MCDFLQRDNGHDARVKLIRRAFDWLAPGGCFYLSCLNLNVVNLFKGDLRGVFSDDAIRYERLICDEAMRALLSDKWR